MVLVEESACQCWTNFWVMNRTNENLCQWRLQNCVYDKLWYLLMTMRNWGFENQFVQKRSRCERLCSTFHGSLRIPGIEILE